MIRVGESGTVLTEAWTGPFEIRPLLNYVAPRKSTERFIFNVVLMSVLDL